MLEAAVPAAEAPTTAAAPQGRQGRQQGAPQPLDLFSLGVTAMGAHCHGQTPTFVTLEACV